MVSRHSLHSRITKSCFGLPCQVRGQCTAAEHARDTLQQTIRELECQRIEEASRSRERDRVQEAELKQARLDVVRLSATDGRLLAAAGEAGGAVTVDRDLSPEQRGTKLQEPPEGSMADVVTAQEAGHSPKPLWIGANVNSARLRRGSERTMRAQEAAAAAILEEARHALPPS